jgi:PAS domain S-box-containing protein
LDQDYSKPLPLENKEFSESENLYLDIFNASSQFMYFFYVDSSLILREINNRYIELLKVPRTEIIGNHISEIFPSKLYTSVIEKHIIDALAGKTANRELWIHGEERSIYMSINATGRKDNEGNTVGAVIMGFDMTEQKLAEESLVKSDEFHKEIQSLAKLGGWEVFIESGKINLSDEMFQIFKFNRDDFDGKFSTLINYIHEDDRERLSESRNKALQSGKPYIFDYRIITTQGDTRHLKGHARVIKDENNNPVKFIGASLDVTSEKLTELALIENQKLLKEAQNIANLGFWDFDFMTQRLKWSDEAYEIFQLPPEEYLATTKDYVKRIHSDDMERATKDFENTLRNGEPLDHEYRIVRPDGSIRHIYVRAELKLNARNESEKLFGTILDITDLKQTEYALKRTEALLRRYFDADLIGMAITSADRR